MKIIFEPQTEVILTAWVMATRTRDFSHEFSGLADVVRSNGNFLVSAPHVMDVGSVGYTEFDPDKIIQLPASETGSRRCWFHKHPITGWSGTDMFTMTHTPCGGIPEIMQWALAIVHTPMGWIGKLSFFVPKLVQFDVPVEHRTPSNEIVKLARVYKKENNLDSLTRIMYADFEKRMYEQRHREMASYFDEDEEELDGWDDPEYDLPSSRQMELSRE